MANSRFLKVRSLNLYYLQYECLALFSIAVPLYICTTWTYTSASVLLSCLRLRMCHRRCHRKYRYLGLHCFVGPTHPVLPSPQPLCRLTRRPCLAATSSAAEVSPRATRGPTLITTTQTTSGYYSNVRWGTTLIMTFDGFYRSGQRMAIAMVILEATASNNNE